jgi:hypothetical protein
MVEIYAEFGLVLKDTATLVTFDYGKIDKRHSFLGSNAVWDEFHQQYIPYPRMGKICSSLIFDPLEPMTPLDMFQRSINLAVLAYADCKIFDIIIKYAKFQYKNLPLIDQLKADDFLETQQINLDVRDSFLNVVTGRE